MAEYKLYCLDQAGRISRRREFEADDDDAALVLARELESTTTCELWSGTRKVALLPVGGAPVFARDRA